MKTFSDAMSVQVSLTPRRPAAPLTARQLEKHLAAALSTIAESALPNISEARAVRARIRGRYGFNAVSAPLLTAPDGNEKAAKGRGLPIWTLSLAPAATSKIAELCAYRGACSTPCVAHAGNGSFPASVRARQARTALLVEDPAAFLAMLVHELDSATRDRAGRRNSRAVAARLNTFSDLRWERVLPGWFWSRFSRVRFYDYTKHPYLSRPAETLPSNYALSYSISERSTPRDVTRHLAAGRSVVAVIPTRGGTDRRTGRMRPIDHMTSTIVRHAGRPMVDGDTDDRRYLDPPGAVVILRRKGTLRADDALILDADQLGNLLRGE